MNPERDELQKLWQEENSGAGNMSIPDGPAEAILRKSSAEGDSPAARMRRRVRLDGWIKIGAILFILAALPVMAGRFSSPLWGVLGFSLLGVLLGAAQLSWSGGWRQANAAVPLAESLTADLEVWRRRRPALTLLLGATPALAWQVYQLVYLAMMPSRPGPIGLQNLLFLTAGGPLIWLLSSWRQRARLDVWLLQIEQALGAFDEEKAQVFFIAQQRAARRANILMVIFLMLLLSGVMLYWLTR